MALANAEGFCAPEKFFSHIYKIDPKIKSEHFTGLEIFRSFWTLSGLGMAMRMRMMRIVGKKKQGQK